MRQIVGQLAQAIHGDFVGGHVVERRLGRGGTRLIEACKAARAPRPFAPEQRTPGDHIADERRQRNPRGLRLMKNQQHDGRGAQRKRD